MGGRRSTIWAALMGAVVGMVLAPVVHGEQGDAGTGAIERGTFFDATGPVRLMGQTDLGMAAAGLVFNSQDSIPVPEISVEFEDARVRWIGFPRVETEVGPVGPVSGPGATETYIDTRVAGTVVIDRWLADGTVRVLPIQGDSSFSATGQWNGTVVVQPPARGGSTTDAISFWEPVLGLPVGPSGAAATANALGWGMDSIDGSISVVMYGVEATLFDGKRELQIATGERLDPDESTMVPGTDYGVRVYNRSVMVVEATSARVAVTGTERPVSWAFLWADGFVDGTIHMSAIEGDLVAGRSTTAVSATLAEMEGRMALQATPDADTGQTGWNLTGDADAVRIDGKAVHLANRGPSVDRVMVSGLLGATLAILAKAAWSFKGTVVAFLRGRQGRPGETRRKLVALIEENDEYWPLWTLMTTASRRLDISPMAVYRHARALRREGEVDFVRLASGRAWFVGPKDGRVNDAASKAARALLAAPLGALVARAICNGPGRTQSDVIAEVQQAAMKYGAKPGPVSAVAVHKWIKRFEACQILAPGSGASAGAAGDGETVLALVERRRDGRFVRYWPTEKLRSAVLSASSLAPASQGRLATEPIRQAVN